MNKKTAIEIVGVKKQYRIGQIGGGSLQNDLQTWWARKRGKEDPNSKIGTDQRLIGKTFMALNGIDLEIFEGEAIGIIGKNGAGKSTLLKLLSRVTAPTSGTIDIYGRITSMLEVGTGFHREMTGRENVYMNGAILGMTKTEIDAKMNQIIEFSEVGDFIDTPVKRYSSGMYVKLAFSVAAHLDSEIMIMDEVLAVGDMAFQQKCLNKMSAASRMEGKTILYVSHNMNTIRKLCSRCIVLDEGKIVFDGDVEKAIAIYNGKSLTSETNKRYSVDDHEKWCAQRLFIKEARINEDVFNLYCGNILHFSLKCDVKEIMNNVMIRLVILDGDGQVLGMSMTKESIIFSNIGENTIELSFDTKHMAPGNYSCRISFFEINEYGMHEYVCVINDFYGFLLHDEPNIHGNVNWEKKSWGYFAFDSLGVSKY